MAHPNTASRAYRAFAWVVCRAVHLVVKASWEGTEHFPASGGFIAAANHATEADALSFAVYLYESGYQPRILAKRGLFTAPVIGPLMRLTKMIPVDRGSKAAGHALAVGKAELDDGACVAIFPEGTLTRDPDLWPMEGKTGLARLALASRVPVIPVAQWGMNDLLARYGRKLHPFRRPRVVVRAGPAVDLSDLYDQPHDTATLREATSRVMDAISRGLEPLRGGVAPSPRFDLHKHPDYDHKQTDYPPVERP